MGRRKLGTPQNELFTQKINLYVSKEQEHALWIRSSLVYQKSINDLVRIAIDEFIENHELKISD